jgi:CRP/FNR family cyclic AMP-dependent transcriptional regulator
MESLEFFKSILKEHPFFKSFPEEHLITLAGCASNMRLREGEYLFRNGDPADNFYIVREGRVSINLATVDRGEIIVETLGEDEVIGWSWLFPPYIWHYDAHVVNETRLIGLDGRCLRSKCEADPAMGYALMKQFSGMMVERLKATQLQLLDIYGQKGQS